MSFTEVRFAIYFSICQPAHPYLVPDVNLYRHIYLFLRVCIFQFLFVPMIHNGILVFASLRQSLSISINLHHNFFIAVYIYLYLLLSLWIFNLCIYPSIPSSISIPILTCVWNFLFFYLFIFTLYLYAFLHLFFFIVVFAFFKLLYLYLCLSIYLASSVLSFFH